MVEVPKLVKVPAKEAKRTKMRRRGWGISLFYTG